MAQHAPARARGTTPAPGRPDVDARPHRSSPPRPLWGILLGLLLSAAPAQLQAAGRGVEFRYQIHQRVQQGAAQGPGLVLLPATTAVGVRLALRRDDGRNLDFSAARIGAGESRAFSWEQPLGTMHYRAALTAASVQGEEVTIRFEFEISVRPPLQVSVLPDELDLARRQLAFVADRPVSRVELQLFAPDGRPLGQAAQPFDPPAPASGAVRVQWPEIDGELRTISMRVHDTEGFWTDTEFLAWWFEVEHEEISFASGSAAFGSEEAAKIERTLTAIREVLTKTPPGLPLRLYVAGYTDTVGTAPSNDRLSRERALAIGQAFVRAGLGLPVFYQGFGEQVLARPTADETDEPANRRALYVLGTAPPPRSGALPRADWQPLPLAPATAR